MVLDLKGDSAPPHGSTSQVRTWSAIGAILFVLLVLLCQGFSLLLSFHGSGFERLYNNKHFGVRLLLAVVSLLFQLLLLTGTLFFSLVVKAYVPGAGWTAFGITLACLVVSLLFWAQRMAWECLSQIRETLETKLERAESQLKRARGEDDGNDAKGRAVKDAEATLQKTKSKLARVRSARGEPDKTKGESGVMKERSSQLADSSAEDGLRRSHKGLCGQQTENQPGAAGVAAKPGEGHQRPTLPQSSTSASQTWVSARSEQGEDPGQSIPATQIQSPASPRGEKNAISEGDIV